MKDVKEIHVVKQDIYHKIYYVEIGLHKNFINTYDQDRDSVSNKYVCVERGGRNLGNQIRREQGQMRGYLEKW